MEKSTFYHYICITVCFVAGYFKRGNKIQTPMQICISLVEAVP